MVCMKGSGRGGSWELRQNQIRGVMNMAWIHGEVSVLVNPLEDGLVLGPFFDRFLLRAASLPPPNRICRLRGRGQSWLSPSERTASTLGGSLKSEEPGLRLTPAQPQRARPGAQN